LCASAFKVSHTPPASISSRHRANWCRFEKMTKRMEEVKRLN
jgi:hypothetical protein